MNCPVCDEKLRTVEKHGIEVDICPGCKGVWLDRGELDKIIDAVNEGAVPVSAMAQPSAAPQPPAPALQPPMPTAAAQGATPRQDYYPSDRHHGERDDGDHDEEHRYHERGVQERGEARPRRRGSWLAEVLGGIAGGGDD